MKFLVVTFVVLGLILSNVHPGSASCEKPKPKPKPKCKPTPAPTPAPVKPCPVFKITKDLTDPAILDDVQDDIFEDLWDADSPTLSKKGEKLKDIIFKLRESGIPMFESYAFAVSEWVWAYLPQMSRKPDLTPYQNLVLADIAFALSGGTDCASITKAVNDVKPSFVEALNFALDNAIENSKCRQVAEIKPKKGKKGWCKGNTDIWDNAGWVFPSQWKDVVDAMVESSKDYNRIIGFFALTFMSPSMLGIENAIDKPFLYQIFSMAATEELPKNCCDAFITDQMNLRKQIVAEIDEAAEEYLTKIGC